VSASGTASMTIYPSTEKEVGSYTLYLEYAELFTPDMYTIEKTYQVTVTPDTADDASIADKFKELKKAYDDDMLSDN
jgi:hypothetical protein